MKIGVIVESFREPLYTAFESAASEKIFEDKNNGMLA